MSRQKLKLLSNTLYSTSRNSSRSKSGFRTKAVSQREESRRKYQALTNYSRQQQKEYVRGSITARTPLWKQDHYRISNTFSLFPKQQVEPFPHNNKKYNIQFLDRSLHGKNLKFPSKQWGYFEKPKDKLYSEHFKPIVEDKRKYNEDYELRTSLFGQTWVDFKRDHIMDEYKLQVNPFRTPRSNNLISTMHKDRNFRRF